jgi:alpha-L-rhamnosidase
VTVRILLMLMALSIGEVAFASPAHLRCEYLENPLGIDQAAPRLSWQSDNIERNWEQSAYQILVANDLDALNDGRANVWDSGKVASSQSVGVVYAGPKLEPQKRYYWKVRVWDLHGQVSESREIAWWEMGLLSAGDWKAQWVAWQNPESEADRSSVRWIWVPGQNALDVAPKTIAMFRSKVQVAEKPWNAALFVSARGDFVARVNGHEACRKSNWVAFDRCDITDALTVGDNSIELRLTSPDIRSFGPEKVAKTMTAAVTALVKLSFSNGNTSRNATGEAWEAKLAAAADWRPAHVVGSLNDKSFGDPGPLPEPAAYIRKTVEIRDKVKNARLFVTALGSYQFFLNGQRVGNYAFTPEFTDYRKRALYQTYEVSPALVKGRNVLAAFLGDGWYGSPLTWVGLHFFTPPNRLMAQLEIEYTDGRHETIVSDESWKGHASPILRSDIYAGEVYDARLEQVGWQTASFDDSGWSPVRVGDTPAIQISSQITVPTRVVMPLHAQSVTRVADGTYIFDMGQNMVGWTTLRVKGTTGARIRLRFAEILNPDGTIYTDNLRNADATDVYVVKGEEEETFRPHFTFHGFRYVAVSGFPGEPDLESLTGEAVSSVGDQPTASVKTSSELVNRMWSIGVWGQRGNFLSIPTDCPQRDERLGWMGDAGVFWRTGSYNFDIAAFSQKFIQDIVDAQTVQGAFTNVSPNVLPFGGSGTEGTSAWSEGMVGAPGWGDAGVIVPWTTWVQYGDPDVIARNWNAMERWMKFIQDRNPDFLRKNGVGPNFADWLAPDEHTDKDLLATAYWALITDMMSQMAHAAGKDADTKRYQNLLANIRGAFRKAYIKDDGTVGTGTQTSYVVALYTKMAPPSLEPKLTQNLVRDIESRNWHLSTGFLGTPFLLFVLTDHGRSDIAYRLLLNETYPSWGYMLSKGATTWWERWNGDTGDPAMNSYNHYAFGSVVAWVYRDVIGIDANLEAPGFKKILVRPHTDSRLTFASGEYDSVYGKISTEWRTTSEGHFQLNVTIPSNTKADIFLPATPGASAFQDGRKLIPEIRDGAFVVPLGSGTYHFEVR